MKTGRFRGSAKSLKPPDLAWHARGRGFKSPQLHAGRVRDLTAFRQPEIIEKSSASGQGISLIGHCVALVGL